MTWNPAKKRQPANPLGKLSPDERRALILAAAVGLAEVYGFRDITRKMIAAAAQCSAALVNYYFTIPELQTAIMHHAIETENATLLRQGLLAQHPAVTGLPKEIKARALNTLLT